ncbi:hypothetical protein BGZ99_004552 [Dissophora globulifera]|uniref:F-box domain-containing protein n=1 Tax=Dissophora globulifera TaxID=979702 RepID=A0A9P6RJG3_9FUNG|nr:hypothetical protein BGZ99_004552 [Dissophora globulifera]
MPAHLRRTPAGQDDIRVFDIPELLLPILSCLAPHDLLNCLVVSKQFHALCIPILYSSITIIYPLQFHRFLSTESQAALARYSSHIRTFKTQYYSLLRCLIPDAINCQSLTHLEFPETCRFTDPGIPREFSQSTSSFTFSTSSRNTGSDVTHRDPENSTLMVRARNASGLFDGSLLLEVMAKSPRLSTFVMGGFPFDHDQLIRQIGDQLVTSSLAQVRPNALKRLELTNRHYCRVRVKSIEHLLSRCTPNMEDLSLSISSGSTAEVETDDDMEDIEEPQMPINNGSINDARNDQNAISNSKVDDGSWNLRRLTLRGNLSGRGPLIWLPLLRRCPALQDLIVDLFTDTSVIQLALTLGRSCPQISVMTVKCMMASPQEDSRIADLIQSSLSWRRLSMSFFHGFGPQSIAALVKHSQTLETLILSECDGFTSEDIQTVLSSCPNLRTFQAMTSNGMQFSSTVYLDANEMVDSPWVCHRLENLKLVITGMARPDLQIDQYGQALTGPLHDGTITGFEQQRIVYQQLGQLTRLQVLWLGHEKQDLDDEENYHRTEVQGQWRYIDPEEQFECLEFSLRSGLDLLVGLKDLRVLNLDRMRTRIGLSEVQWMVKHWPKLDTIIGLVVQNEMVPKHVQWLYDHRPDIALPPVLGNFITAFYR